MEGLRAPAGKTTAAASRPSPSRPRKKKAVESSSSKSAARRSDVRKTNPSSRSGRAKQPVSTPDMEWLDVATDSSSASSLPPSKSKVATKRKKKKTKKLERVPQKNLVIGVAGAMAGVLLLGFILSTVLSSGTESAVDIANNALANSAQSESRPRPTTKSSTKALSTGEIEPRQSNETGGTVYLHETFDGYEIGRAPEAPQLQCVEMVKVVDGGGRAGSGLVAHFDDSVTSQGGAMELSLIHI